MTLPPCLSFPRLLLLAILTTGCGGVPDAFRVGQSKRLTQGNTTRTVSGRQPRVGEQVTYSVSDRCPRRASSLGYASSSTLFTHGCMVDRVELKAVTLEPDGMGTLEYSKGQGWSRQARVTWRRAGSARLIFRGTVDGEPARQVVQVTVRP